MSCRCATFYLIFLILTFTEQRCWCFSEVQTKETSERLALPRVSCSARRLKAVFGPLVRDNVLVRDISGATVPVLQSEESCGVRISRDEDQNLSFFSRYNSCYAQMEGSKVVIPLQVQLEGEDDWFRVNISCPLIKRHRENLLIPTALPKKCLIDRKLRLECGHKRISSKVCYELGCCYDAKDLMCYYRLDECSLDGHFVFSVRSTEMTTSVDLSSLRAKDQPQCPPAVITSDAAVFKIGVTECGAKMRVDGDVVIYEMEVEDMQTSPFRLQVQCEYEPADLMRAKGLQSLNEFTNPPPVAAVGTIRVQMRIARDESFTSFYPEDQLPLTLPLRKAAYVEISIAQPSPDPSLSLRVRDCFAYPASRRSVWTLLYDGCPNPLDDMKSSVPVDKWGNTTSHSQIRRFDVKTFAFMDPDTGHPSVEEMFFCCWVEICTEEDDCAQSCGIISSESKRQRREAPSEQDLVQLVSFGPLLVGQNSTDVEDSSCVDNKRFHLAVFLLTGVGVAFLLVLLFTVWPCIKKCRKPQVQQVDSEQCE